MTTKVVKKGVKSNFPPLENYLDSKDSKEITVFSALFQKYNPYQIYKTLDLFETDIPIVEGGELVESIHFIVRHLKRDFLSIYAIIKGLDVFSNECLEEKINDLNRYMSPLEVYQCFDCLVKFSLYNHNAYNKIDYDVFFDLKNTFFQLHKLDKKCKCSTLEMR